MKKPGFTILEITMVLILVAVLISLALPNLKRQRIVANELAAEATLKMIGQAFGSYALNNLGLYPASEADLTTGNTPYLDRDYNGNRFQGYDYTYHFIPAWSNYYLLEAQPARCNDTGIKEFYVEPNGGLIVCDCNVDGDCGIDTCGADFDRDGDVDTDDENIFLIDFGRSIWFRRCTPLDPCYGNFDGDMDIDGDDTSAFIGHRDDTSGACFR